MIVLAVLTIIACVVLTPILFHIAARGLWPVEAGSGKAVQGNLYSSFDLSPDGKQIVFSAATGESKCLYLLDLPTQKVTQLTALPDYCAYPAFSPDGKSIVYERAESLDKPRYLFIRSLDGKHVRQLTSGTPTNDECPSFSRDGKKIVFSRARSFYGDKRGENTWNDRDVYTIHTDGSNLKQLTFLQSKGVIRPQFSPDARTIIFEQTFSSNTETQGHISQINSVTGGELDEVVHFGQDDFNPCFLPDGKQIVFASNSGGGVDLWRVSLDGGKPTRITDTGDSWGNPCLTPDAKSVIYSGGSNPNIGIHQIDLDGTHQRIIAGQSLFDDPLHWHSGK